MEQHDSDSLFPDPRPDHDHRSDLRTGAPVSGPERCGCPDCRKLDRRWPKDGYQLKLIDGGRQDAPTDEESAQHLFSLAGIDHIPRRRPHFE